MEEPTYFRSDTEFAEEQRRLQLIEAEQDPTTIRHLTDLGVEEGWECLEVGAGGGSIARWLANRVGPAGRVLATDVDVRFLEHERPSNLEVSRHDISRDQLFGEYDLVHCRSLLVHLRERQDVLRRMFDVLRPGGWLLAEENYMPVMKAADPLHPLAANFDEVHVKSFDYLLAANIFDVFWATQLPEMFGSLGVVDAGNESTGRIVRGGEPWTVMLRLSNTKLDDVFVSNGVLTESEIADKNRALDDESFFFTSQALISAWGRRPGVTNPVCKTP